MNHTRSLKITKITTYVVNIDYKVKEETRVIRENHNFRGGGRENNFIMRGNADVKSTCSVKTPLKASTKVLPNILFYLCSMNDHFDMFEYIFWSMNGTCPLRDTDGAVAETPYLDAGVVREKT